MLTLSRGAGRVGDACTRTHMYDALAVSHGPCEFTGELWGKRNRGSAGTLTGTAHGAGLHNEAAGHGERAHDQEDNARHYSVKEREAVRDAVAWRGEVKR